jgi:hypothetical protein
MTEQRLKEIRTNLNTYGEYNYTFAQDVKDLLNELDRLRIEIVPNIADEVKRLRSELEEHTTYKSDEDVGVCSELPDYILTSKLLKLPNKVGDTVFVIDGHPEYKSSIKEVVINKFLFNGERLWIEYYSSLPMNAYVWFSQNQRCQQYLELVAEVSEVVDVVETVDATSEVVDSEP